MAQGERIHEPREFAICAPEPGRAWLPPRPNFSRNERSDVSAPPSVLLGGARRGGRSGPRGSEALSGSWKGRREADMAVRAGAGRWYPSCAGVWHRSSASQLDRGKMKSGLETLKKRSSFPPHGPIKRPGRAGQECPQRVGLRPGEFAGRFVSGRVLPKTAPAQNEKRCRNSAEIVQFWFGAGRENPRTKGIRDLCPGTR